MTSQINPDNINGSYPIQGQDNPSQGFRTNFTNIKNNFSYARSEINDLQDNAVLKTTDNDMNGYIIASAQTHNFRETTLDLGLVSALVLNAATFNYSLSPFQILTVDGDATASFTNWSGNGTYSRMRVLLVVTGNYNFDLSTVGVTWWNLDRIPNTFLDVSNTRYRMRLNSGIYLFEFSTYDEGTNIFVTDVFRRNTNTVNYAVANLALFTNNTYPVSGNVSSVLVDYTLGGTVTQGNIDLPANTALMDGQRITIASNVAITNANVRAGSGTYIFGALTQNTWAANSANTWIYNATISTWFRS